MIPSLEINEQFQKAIDLLKNTNKHLFITGKAGSGKSTFLEYFIKKNFEEIIVLAPTGVAAVNIKGETIHSFFKFRPHITVEEAASIGRRFIKSKIFKALKTIVIDEVSMVRADLLDCVNIFLCKARQNKKPFGGVRMIFIGDLYQLPPVVRKDEKEAIQSKYKSPYFFDSYVMKNLLAETGESQIAFVEFEKIYRQTNLEFIELLNCVRNRSVTPKHLEKLNSRCKENISDIMDGYIYLTTINKQADEINLRNIEKLTTKAYYYEAEISGEFGESYYPSDKKLALKVGARIMFLNNDSLRRWINGTVGTIVKLTAENICVQLSNKEIVEVDPFKWIIYKTLYNKNNKSIEKEEVGSFIQFPLMLAWAITIHKSQGKTFDKAIIDIGRGVFAHGQVYVALSRCRSLEGIILKTPIKKGHILMDWCIVKFLTSFQYQLAEKNMSLKEKINLLKDAIDKNKNLEIIYLKSKDEKSKRIVKPVKVEKMEYKGYEFLGVEAYCLNRKENRVFNVDRILEINLI